jgi:hypothetical protein
MNFNSISTFYINLYKLNNQELFLARSLSKLKGNSLAVLNILIWYSNIYGRIFPSHETLAEKTGLCTKTISRHIKLLVKLGFIVVRELHRNSNSYYLNPIFLRMKFRNAMRFILTNLKWFTFKLMLSVTLSTLAFENTCLLETVQSLIYKPYIKKKSQNSQLYNESLKNQSDLNVKVYKDVANVTNRKRGDVVMLQSEIIISGYVAKIAKQFGFTREQEIKLATYSDDIVCKAYSKMLGKKIERPFNYLLSVCSSEAAKQPKITRLEATHKPMAVKLKEVNIGGEFHKNYTAVQISQQMAEIESKPGKIMFGGEGYQERILREWAEKEYIADGSQAEYIALRYIDKFRLRFNMTPRCPINQPQSTTLNEKGISGTTSQEVKKDSTSLILERNDEYEEVTDEILYG